MTTARDSVPLTCAIVAETDIDTNEYVYLFTWTPNPAYLSHDQDDNYIKHYAKFFIKWKICHSFYAIAPEFNASGNIHYHGWYQIKDPIRWYKIVMPSMKRFGFMKINKMNNIKALHYYKKDLDMMYDAFTNLPIPVPITHNDSLTKVALDSKKKKHKRMYAYIKQHLNHNWELLKDRDIEDQTADICALLKI